MVALFLSISLSLLRQGAPGSAKERLGAPWSAWERLVAPGEGISKISPHIRAPDADTQREHPRTHIVNHAYPRRTTYITHDVNHADAYARRVTWAPSDAQRKSRTT